MQTEAVANKKDWKEEFAFQLKRERMLIRMNNVADILTFLASYFDDLENQMNEISENSFEFKPSNGMGMIYSIFNDYKSAKIEYRGENGAVTIKTITQDAMGDRNISSKVLGFIAINDGVPLIVSADEHGQAIDERFPLTVKRLDTLVEDYFMNVI